MPQPRAPPQQRGNSAMAQFKPKRWQVEDRCGICGLEFSLLNKRHHCRFCGQSVCGKHSKNKVIVPTSLAKVPQRVCDKCHPKCRGAAMGRASPPAPPLRQGLPDDIPRRHTLESRDEGDNGRRMRSPGIGQRKSATRDQRENKTWTRGGTRQLIRRDERNPRVIESARDQHMRSPHTAKSPRGRDKALHFRDLSNEPEPRKKNEPQEKRLNKDPRERNLREKEPRERSPRDRDRRRQDPREREPRGRDPRERAHRKRDPREREMRERGRRDRNPQERDRPDRALTQRDLFGEAPERDRRDRALTKQDLFGEAPERDRRDKALHKRDLFGKAPERDRRDRALTKQDLFDEASEKDRRELLARMERRRVMTTEPIRNRKHAQMRCPVPSQVNRKETSSTCRTTSSTLSNLYAAMKADEATKLKIPPPKSKQRRLSPHKEKEKEKQSAFADSAFSIFSLAESDHSDSAADAPGPTAQKIPAPRPKKGPSSSVKRESMEKKEHLDFGASSVSAKSLEMSLLTQKYLKPQLRAKLAEVETSLKPMTEGGGGSDEVSAKLRRRKADPRSHKSERRRNANEGKHGKKARGEAPRKLPPSQHDMPADASFRNSSAILQEVKKSSAQDKGPKHRLSISEFNGFESTQFLLSGDKDSSGDMNGKEEEEAFTKLLAASNRGKEDLTNKLRAKKAAIAGIDPVSLDAKEKAPTTANYKLTTRDKEMMRQISKLEETVLEHQKELLELLDMYGEATKRAKKAQNELRKAKMRVVRYEKAHAAVSRAICSGKLYIQQKEYMAAILELSRATVIDRSNATLWYMLAECRLMVDEPAAAEDACLTSLKLKPTGAAVVMLGRIMHKRGRHDEAIECYLSALGRNDENEEGSE